MGKLKKKLLNRLCAAVSAVIMAVTTYGVAPTFATEASTEGSIINIMPLVDFDDWTDETVAAGTQYSGNSKPAGEVFFAMNNPGTVSIKSRGTGDKYLVNGIAEFSYMRSDNASTLGNADALSDGEQMVFSFETFSGTGKSSSASIRMDNDEGPTNLFSTSNNTLNLYNAVADESSNTKGSVIGTYTMPNNQWVKVDLVYTRNGTTSNGSVCDSLVVYINNKTVKPVCAGGAEYSGKVIPMTGSILDSKVSRFTFAGGVYDNMGAYHYVDGATYKKSGKVITTVVPMINFDSYETAEIPVGGKDDNADVTQWSTMQPIFSVQNDSEYVGKIYVTVATKDGTTDRYYSGAYNKYDTGTSARVEVKYSADKNGRLKNIPLSEGEKLEYGISVHSDKSFWMYNRTDGDADTSGILNYLFRVDGGMLYVFDGNSTSNAKDKALGYITLPSDQWVDVRIVYTAGDGVDNNLSSGGTDDTVEVYLGSDVQTLTANSSYSGNGSVSSDGINKLAVDYLGSSTSRLSFDPKGTFDNFSVTKYADKAEEKEEVNPSLLGIDHQPNDFTYFHSERVMLGSKDYEFASIMASSGNSYVIEPADKKNQKGDKLILTRGSDEAGENSLVNLNVPTYGVTTDLIPFDKEFKYFMIDGLFHFTSRDIGGPFIVMGDDISTEGAYSEAVTLSDGKLIAGSGEKDINITDWHHLQMIVNIEDGYYDVIVDGELLCQNVAIGDDIEILSNISMTINEGIGTLEIREMEVTGLSKEPSLTRNYGVYDFDIVHTSQFIDDNLTRTYLFDKVVFHGDGDMTYNRGTKTEYDKGSFVYDDEERELYVPLSVINEQLDAEVEFVNNQWVKGGTVLAKKEVESGIDVIMPMIDFDDWQSETIKAEAIYSGNEELTGQVFYAMNKGGKIDVRSRKTGDKYIVNGLSEFAYRSKENSDNFRNLTALDPGEQMVISFETNPAIVGFASANIRSNPNVDDGPTTIYSIESNMLNIYDGIPEYIEEDEHITSGTIIGKYTLPKNRWSEVNLVYTRLGTTKDGVPCDSIEVYVDGKLVKLTAATDMPINSMVVPLSQSFIDAKALRFTFDRGAYDNLGIKIYRDGRVFSTDEEENTKYYKGEPLAPVKTIAEALGYTCEFYKYGKMVMIAEGDAELPESNDLDAQPWFDEQYYSKGWCVHPQTVLSDAQEISNFIFYDRPTAQQLEETYNSKAQSHPRIVLTPDKVAAIRDRIAADNASSTYAGVYTDAIAKIESDANEVIKENYLVNYEFEDNYRTLAAARKFEYNMIKLGLAYQFTSDDNLKKKCADLAVSNMKKVVKFPDFNYGHVIDAGEWLYGCAIGFDWFYDKFTEEEREEIAEGILEIGLRPMNRTFYAMLPSALNKDSQGQGNMGNANNFVKWKSNFVPYTQHGLVTASLVLADYEPDVCFDTLEKAIRNWEYSNLGLYPAGGWLEGKSYLSVVHNNTAAAFSSLLNVMGDEYNVLEATGVEESLDKVIQLTSQTGSFVYADENVYGGGMSGVPVSASFYADYYGRDDIERIRQWRYRYGDINAWYFMDTIFYQHFDDQQLIQKAKSYTSLDTINYTEGTEIVTIHEDWAAGASLFFALAGGPTRHYHFHNDGGDFSLCMDGARWSYEMGTSDYNIGTNYSKYAGRAEGHNTLVINPDDDPAAGESVDNSYTWTAQKEQSFAAVMDYGEIEGGAYTTLDMSQLYEDAGAVRVHRGAWIDENYDVVTLRDEIEFAEDEEFDGWWFMHTKADYERINDNTILLKMYDNKGKEEYVSTLVEAEVESAANNGTPMTEAEKSERTTHYEGVFDRNAKSLYLQIQVDGADRYDVQWMDPNPLESSPQTKSDPTNKKGVHKIGIYYQGSGEIDITVRMSNTWGDTIDTTPISQWLISDLYKEGDDIKINLLGDYDDNYRLFVAEHKDGKFVAANTGEATYDAARGQYKCTVTPITEDADECVIYLWNEESYAPIRKLVRIRMSDLVIIE